MTVICIACMQCIPLLTVCGGCAWVVCGLCVGCVCTCGACMRFISSRRVCRWPSAGRLFFRASNRKEVHCWTRLPSINTSTICQSEQREGTQAASQRRALDRGVQNGDFNGFRQNLPNRNSEFMINMDFLLWMTNGRAKIETLPVVNDQSES